MNLEEIVYVRYIKYQMQLPVLKCERVGIQDCSYSVKNMYKQNIYVSWMAGIGVNQLDL